METFKVLIADDEPHITRILSFKLKRAGVDVLVASNGEEALSMAIKHRPAAVVSDYQMPVMSGLEFARALRANETTRDIPVIMLTARSHRLPASELVETNIRCLLDKPFSAVELISQLEELLGESGHSSSAA